ncbi:MAG: nuclear transport factor 2 family protein [Gammaproteobacteria bacterium]
MATASELEARTAVTRVIAVLSGDTPLAGVEACLDRDVIIHVDGSETHRGIALWKRWVHLMRERGRLHDLRFEPEMTEVTDGVVDVTFQWSGGVRRGRDTGRPRTLNHVRYRVEDDRIVEIWTRKANYVDVFGPWIRLTPLYRLFLLWGLVYFLARRDPAFRLDP